MTAELIGIITALAAVVMVIVQVAKLLPLPKDADGKLMWPKLITLIFAFLVIGIPAFADGKFTQANAPALGAAIGAVSVTAYGLYDITKPAWEALKKLWLALKAWYAARKL